MSKSTYHTTKTEFETFKKTFLAWRKRLGLTEWRVCFKHGPLEEMYASLMAHSEGRIVTVTLTTEIPSDCVAHFNPKESARHEALELLTTTLDYIARCRHCQEEEVTEARHAIIRRLESLFDEMEK
jgi:hypothetical protein